MSDWKRERREREKAQAQRREKAEALRRRQGKPSTSLEPKFRGGGFVSSLTEIAEAAERMSTALPMQAALYELVARYELPARASRTRQPARRVEAPPRLTGKVVAFRSWSLDGYRLRSANYAQHGGYWEFGPNRAECRVRERIRYLLGIGEVTKALSLKEALRYGQPVPAGARPDPLEWDWASVLAFGCNCPFCSQRATP